MNKCEYQTYAYVLKVGVLYTIEQYMCEDFLFLGIAFN